MPLTSSTRSTTRSQPSRSSVSSPSWSLLFSTCFATLRTLLPVSCHPTGHARPMVIILTTVAVPKEEFAASDQIAAAVFFSTVFGDKGAIALNVLVLCSSFGNLLAVLIGQSRLIREIGRSVLLDDTCVDSTDGMLQSRCSSVPQVLGVYQAFRNPIWTLRSQVGDDAHHDRCTARRRCLPVR